MSVSILTRPEAGCDMLADCACGIMRSGFNPHPARRPGATADRGRWADADAMFQSSPGPKTGCNAAIAPRDAPIRDVSILTRPEDRVRRRRLTTRSRSACLVSILTRPEAGCDAASRQLRVCRADGFNPHPARSRVQRRRAHGVVRRSMVSILTRPEDRVRPAVPARTTTADRRFNPHPARSRVRPSSGRSARAVAI